MQLKLQNGATETEICTIRHYNYVHKLNKKKKNELPVHVCSITNRNTRHCRYYWR